MIVETKGTGASARGQWLATRVLNPHARLRLFCFPYAGGSALIYRKWQEAFPTSSGVEVLPVQLPGRGNRLNEPAFTRWEPLVEALAAALSPHFDRPFAFFGHSMGALLAFELARLLQQRGQSGPQRLFASGSPAPHLRSDEPHTYDLPDAEFIEELRRLKGTPTEVLENPELMQLMMPLLRADFAMTQTYVYRESPTLTCPFIVFGGREDEEVRGEKLSAWCKLTSGGYSLKLFEGGHFFIHKAEEQLLRALKPELLLPHAP
jgi:medium-chain acyl-[acyl-carrier-protein] hydrolase